MAAHKKPTPTVAPLINPPTGGDLMARVSGILDQARANVVRAVNSNMVIAYWLIGREIVHALQGGEERAEYGAQVLSELSRALTGRYGRGFSVTNLKYFRLFYQAYSERQPQIRHEPRDELVARGRRARVGGRPQHCPLRFSPAFVIRALRDATHRHLARRAHCPANESAVRSNVISV